MSSIIKRNLLEVIKESASYYPVVTLTGPRQSGKTVLCQAAFPDRRYVSLEPLDIREYARSDPRGFLAEHRDGAIIDEVQHVPELFPYLQEEVDRTSEEPGRFILTGSQNLALLSGITQSLAGRTAVLNLFPPSLDELRRFEYEDTPWTVDLFTTLFTGAYPRIHHRGVPARRWLTDYVTTYVQRDVRQVLQIGDLQAFTTFLRLCAGRTGQELNLSSLGADAGVSHNTARSWLSALEAGFICFRLPAWHSNVRKQLVKAPKLHFFDSGLVCQLLGIQEPAQLCHHPLRGAIFESWVAAEAYKAWANGGLEPRLYHFRESRGLEVDLVADRPGAPLLVESKSGATVASSFFTPMRRLAELLRRTSGLQPAEQVLVFGGDKAQHRSEVTVLPWHRVDEVKWTS